jgi:hypothetical protein
VPLAAEADEPLVNLLSVTLAQVERAGLVLGYEQARAQKTVPGRRGRNAPPHRDTLAEIRDIVAVRTSGYRPGGLRCDFSRFSEDEHRRAIELVREADKGTWSWDRLGKPGKGKRGELEGLIEKASAEPGIFARARELDEIAAIAAEAHRESVRRPLHRKQEASIFAELGKCIENGWLEAPHVAVLALVLVAFSTGRPLGPRGRVESLDGGLVALVVDSQFGPFSGALDPEGQLAPRWAQTADHLVANEWLAVTKNGREWWVSPGARLRAVMAGRPVKDEVRAA